MQSLRHRAHKDYLEKRQARGREKNLTLPIQEYNKAPLQGKPWVLANHLFCVLPLQNELFLSINYLEKDPG